MSPKMIKTLAVSAIAVGTAFVGYGQASAFSFAPTFMLAQSSGGAGTGSGQGGVTGNPGAKSGSAGSQTGGANQPARGSTTPGATTPGTTTPNSASPSAGVPAACASITDATQRQQCVNRGGRK